MLTKDIPKHIEKPDYAEEEHEAHKAYLNEKANEPTDAEKMELFKKQQLEYTKLFDSLKTNQVLMIKGIAFKIHKKSKKDLVLRVIK